jgi:hypothetical protein
MAWFAVMSAADRAAWLAEYERRCAPNRRSRRGARARPAASVHAPVGTAAATSLHNASSDRSTVSGVDEIRELTSIEAFTAAVAADQPLVITDSAKPAKLHPAPHACSGVTADYFVGKVITRGGRGGRYFTVASEAAALKRWPKTTICANCGQ